MNIFAIEGADNNIDWVQSAKSQDNYRVVKMILESCQMLCTTLNEQAGTQVTPYRTTHKHHPSTKWVCESSANFESLIEHTLAMLEEYTERFGRTHKCLHVLEECLELYNPSLFPSTAPTLHVLEECLELYNPSLFPSTAPTALPLAMPTEFQSDSIVESYRRFYASKPRVRYPANKIPKWFIKYRGKKDFDIV